jgi:hypothetical protein
LASIYPGELFLSRGKFRPLKIDKFSVNNVLFGLGFRLGLRPPLKIKPGQPDKIGNETK